MSNEIIATIDHLCDKLGIAIDWTSETIGPMIQEFVEKYTRYLLAYNVLCVIAGIIVMTASCVALCVIAKAIKNQKRWAYSIIYKDINDGVKYILCFLVVVILCCCIALFLFAINIIKCYTVPELLVLQELKKLLG